MKRSDLLGSLSFLIPISFVVFFLLITFRNDYVKVVKVELNGYEKKIILVPDDDKKIAPDEQPDGGGGGRLVGEITGLAVNGPDGAIVGGMFGAQIEGGARAAGTNRATAKTNRTVILVPTFKVTLSDGKQIITEKKYREGCRVTRTEISSQEVEPKMIPGSIAGVY